MLSGEPSNPLRLASTTTGRFPLAALTARATFRDDCGKSVPEVHDGGPSAGTDPVRGRPWDSSPIRQSGIPPMCASHTMAFSPSRQRAQRSNGSWSVSVTARITDRMSKGFLRSPLSSAEKTSPTRSKSDPGTGLCGEAHTSRSGGSLVGARRGPASPGVT